MSSDAAGLAILPGLIRYDEAFGAAPIGHAFRVTVRATNGYVYPASHRAGSTSGALPDGSAGLRPAGPRVFNPRSIRVRHLVLADQRLRADYTSDYDRDRNYIRFAYDYRYGIAALEERPKLVPKYAEAFRNTHRKSGGRSAAAFSCPQRTEESHRASVACHF